MCACVGHPHSNGSYYEVADQDAATINIVVEPPIGFNRYFYGNSTET